MKKIKSDRKRLKIYLHSMCLIQGLIELVCIGFLNESYLQFQHTDQTFVNEK